MVGPNNDNFIPIGSLPIDTIIPENLYEEALEDANGIDEDDRREMKKLKKVAVAVAIEQAQQKRGKRRR